MFDRVTRDATPEVTLLSVKSNLVRLIRAERGFVSLMLLERKFRKVRLVSVASRLVSLMLLERKSKKVRLVRVEIELKFMLVPIKFKPVSCELYS